MLYGKLKIIKTATLEFSEKRELIPDIGEHVGIIVESFLVGDHKPRRRRLGLEVLRNTLPNQVIRDKTDDHPDGN